MPQSLSKIYLHLVFSTKDRERVLFPQHRESLFKYIGGILNGKECPTVIVGGDMDHIHALFCMNRNKTVSEIVRIIKTSSTIWYRQKIGTNFHWQAGYGVFSVSQSQVKKVVEYIADQENHHKRKSFQEEFRGLLDAHGIEYDEKYLWD